LCLPGSDTEQRVVLSNEYCLFVQKPQEVLLGSGLIVPRVHRENVFDQTSLEWQAILDLLHQVKA
jgi:diadenosine tetraphosphate (Ap4A) HIT family hydrolase